MVPHDPIGVRPVRDPARPCAFQVSERKATLQSWSLILYGTAGPACVPGVCAAACNSTKFYASSTTLDCDACDVACVAGCVGPSVADCLPDSTTRRASTAAPLTSATLGSPSATATVAPTTDESAASTTAHDRLAFALTVGILAGVLAVTVAVAMWYRQQVRTIGTNAAQDNGCT